MPGAASLSYPALLESLRPLLPAPLTASYTAGMLGGGVFGASSPATSADVEHLLRPGLAALGLRSEWREAGEKAGRGARLIFFRFGSRPDFCPPRIVEPKGEPPPPAPPLVITVGLTESGDGFARALLLTKAERRGGRAENRAALLLRWLVCAAACPERLPGPSADDAPTRALAAAFLRELAGQRRDFGAVRLREAARCHEAAPAPETLADALRLLREAALYGAELADAPRAALLTPPDEPLGYAERRELVYLARAGTDPLRVLAARRLSPERDLRDARATLEQLAYDPHPYVRLAARL